MKWIINSDSPPPTGLCEYLAVIFVFPLFWDMVVYANEFETKEKQKFNWNEKQPLSYTFLP